jgi:hypothetical protein
MALTGGGKEKRIIESPISKRHYSCAGRGHNDMY